jgi:predicted ATPase/class 3 adenylate cyclase
VRTRREAFAGPGRDVRQRATLPWLGTARDDGWRAMALPAGTVTLLFSDIEGSTRLLEHLGEGYADVLDEHRRIVRGAVAAHGGHELRTEGDAFFVVFARAGDAARAAVAAQRGLAGGAWSGGSRVQVRIGLHTGEPRVVGRDYVGIDVHCAARICSAAHGGQVVVSETTERLLAGEPVAGVSLCDLGEHRLKDLSRPMRLHQIVAAGLPDDFPPLRALEHPPTSAPGRWAPPTALFGRQADLEALVRLVREGGNRLVTLLGPGGVGKTRLAIETAERVAGDFADGARFVPLGAVSEARDLASAIARALAAPVREGEPVRAALLRFLSNRHRLLVLDNFEQLVEGAPVVSELIGACPELTILVTSREPTRLAAERLYPVRPLEVPDASASAAAIERYGSVAMFCERARARDPAFAIDESTAPGVREICRRLDGLPLALELAAARLGLLSVPELAVRLDRALVMLVGGPRDAPERQRTLRATIDWSYDLLTTEERRAFAHMAVFAGGATVAAAEAITAASLETLDSLVAKQLVTRRGGRLLVLETVREYALERLAEDPDRDAVRERLAGWWLSFAREATPHLVRADREPWLARLDAELPNALAALSWALEQRRADLGLRLVGELGEYWLRTSRWEEGLSWLQVALELAPGASHHPHATALLYRARLTNVRRSDQGSRDDLEASLALFRACDDRAGIAACLGELAFAAAWRGRFERAAALSDEAIEFAERAQDEGVLATALSMSAMSVAKYKDAAPRARIALARLQAAGDVRGVAPVCLNIGYLALAERHYEDALAWCDRGLESARRLEDIWQVFCIRTNEALARLFLLQFDEAAKTFCEALTVCHDAGAENIADETLLGFAAAEASRGEFARAPAWPARPPPVSRSRAPSTRTQSGLACATSSLHRRASATAASIGTSPSARERR